MNLKSRSPTSWGRTTSRNFSSSFNLTMTPFAHPSDINWRNISNERRFIGIKRTILVIISFLILIFLTTPTVVPSKPGIGGNGFWKKRSKAIILPEVVPPGSR